MRFYAAPFGLWLTLDAGTFHSVSINLKTHAVRVELSPADRTSQARLRIEQPAKVAGVSRFICEMAGTHPAVAQERGAWVIPLSVQPTRIDLTDLPAK
jgi:hypothetical protein